jgi:RimJ/RimL family protein N-acetyltransferase
MDTNFQILTDRLILRPIRIDDADLIFNYRSDTFVNQYQGWIPKSVEEVRDFINYKVSFEITLPGTWYQFVILQKDNGNLIGDIGIHFLNVDDFQVEIGCTLDKHYHNSGFATEALTSTIGFLFNKLNKRRIIASIDPRNDSSIKLMERLGFRKEAHFKESILINNEWVDDLVYAVLKDEWSNSLTRNDVPNNR